MYSYSPYVDKQTPKKNVNAHWLKMIQNYYPIILEVRIQNGSHWSQGVCRAAELHSSLPWRLQGRICSWPSLASRLPQHSLAHGSLPSSKPAITSPACFSHYISSSHCDSTLFLSLGIILDPTG